MNAGEWAAVAGVLFTAGGFLWGKGFGAGQLKKQMDDVTHALQLLQGEMQTMQANFQNCRLQSAQNTAKAQSAIDGVQADVVRIAETEQGHFGELMNHIGRRDVHTDSEWRSTIITRLDGISSSFEKMIEKIGGLERAVKNGNGNGGK